MENRWYSAIIVVFWLASMSWLISEKVMPPLRVGEPPNYQSLYAVSDQPEPPTCWKMYWNNRELGWAVNRVGRSGSGGTEVHSKAHFVDLPIDQMAPVWTRAIIRNAIKPLGKLELDAHSSIQIDPNGRLLAFKTAVLVSKVPEMIRMTGVVNGSKLDVKVETGDIVYASERYLPENALVSDELSPQSRMPRLRVGQSWTVESYSPFRPPSSPLEVLEAKVEDWDLMIWDERAQNVLLVVYRAESGLGFLSRKDARGKLWVREDGIVLKQEVNLFNSQLTFVRVPPDSVEEFLEQVEGSGAKPRTESKVPLESDQRKSAEASADGLRAREEGALHPVDADGTSE